MKKIYSSIVNLGAFTFFMVLFFVSSSFAQLTGVKAIPTDYLTISAFISDLNTSGVGTGGVQLNVPANYTETLSAQLTVTASGTSANPIVIQKSGSGANPVLTSYAGVNTPISASRDGMICLSGTDYMTINGIDFTEATANTTETTCMEYAIGLFKVDGTNGAQNNAVRNCNIQLSRVGNTNWTGAGHTGSAGIVVLNCTPLANAVLTVTSASGANSNNSFFSNTISRSNSGIVFVGFGAPSPFDMGDQANNVGGFTLATGNNILNFGGAGAALNPATGVFANNQWGGFNCSFNTINNNNGAGVNHPNTLRGIWLNSSSTSASASINNNIVSIFGGGTTQAISGIENSFGSTAASNTININNNTVTGNYLTATTGPVNLIISTSTPQNLNMLNNSVTGFTYSMSANTGTGQILGIANQGTAVNVLIRNNSVTNIARTGSTGGSTWGIISSSGQNIIQRLNTVSNISIAGLGTASQIIGIAGGGTVTSVIDSNTVFNLSCSKTAGISVLYGISNSASSINEQYNNNSINNIAHSGTGTVAGMFFNTLTGVRTVSNNLIHTLSTTGLTIIGINLSTSSSTVFRNKIYNLVSTNVGPTVSAITLASLGTNGFATVYNNIIGDLRAPNATVASGSLPSIRGINMSSTSVGNINIAYNSVYINATSTGANFHTTALFHTVSGTANVSRLVFNNNILVNLSTPTGTGASSAIYRSGILNTNYAATSGNNLLFAGTPGAVNLLYSNGVNFLQTVLDVQTFLGAGTEANSRTGLPSFLSTTASAANFLFIDPAIATVLESGGVSIAGITQDFTGDIRFGNPGYAGTGNATDIGADEFAGTTLLPIVAFVSATPSLAPQCASPASRLVVFNVTTNSGTITNVQLNYAYNGVAQTSVAMVNSSGSAWQGTIPAAGNAVTVTWNVLATNSAAISNGLAGQSYTDVPLNGITAFANNSVTPVCAGSPSSVSVDLFSPVPALYAIPVISSPTIDEDMGSVIITQAATTILSNTTSYNSLVGTIGTATGTAGGYSDFTAFGPYNMTAGLVYDFSISSLQGTGSYGNSSAIFIDYNRNGSFADAGEMVYTPPATILGAHTRTGSFTVPAGAFNGLTRMRIVTLETLIANSATSSSWGEYEDYLINMASSTNGGGLAPVITSISWSNGSTVVGTITPLVVNPIANTTYTATITSLGCPLVSAPTTINVNALPAAPTANNSIHCGAQVPTATVTSAAGAAGNNNYNWYSNAAGTILAQPSLFTSMSTYYTNNFSSAVLANSSISGNASVLANELQLYPNALSQFGAFRVNPAGFTSNKHEIGFKLITQGASVSNMADGVSFSFGNDASTAVEPLMNAENGTGTKLKVSFNYYTNGTSTQGIYLMYNCAVNEQTPSTPGVLAYNNTNLGWVNGTAVVAMTIDSLGIFNMTLDGVALFTNIQLPAAYLSSNQSNWSYVFKGRSGGISSGVTIDDVLIKRSQPMSGNNFVQAPISTTTTYYVNEVGTNGCVSPLTTVTATATLPAAITTTQSANVFCVGGAYTISSSSTASPAYSYAWTALPAAGSGIATSLSGAAQTITPTAGGTYSYLVTGQNGICIEIDTFVVVVNSIFPAAPTASPNLYSTCTGSTTLPISVTAPPSSGVSTILIGTNVSSTGTGATTVSATITGVPAGATITSAQLLFTNVNSINGSYTSEIRVATTGAYTLAQAQISTLTSGGLIAPDPSIILTGFNASTGTINVLLTETFDDGGATTIDATFGTISLIINYTVPPVAISWFASATGGASLGSGTTLESIGTTVISSPASSGSYAYYAQAQISVAGGCASTNRTPITVNVTNVNASLNAVNATCNGTANGSFTLGTVACGAAPFTYSVNGGAFGSIPTNLAAGTYSVVIKDALNNNSPTKSIVITQPVWTVNNAVSANGSACLNDLSEILTASATISTGPAAGIQWYTALTGGTLLGSNATLQTVGTSVLPNTTVPGVYNFYAQGTNAGCFSAARTLVPVTVYALPTVYAGADVVICSNSTTNAQTLTGSGSAVTYTWNNSVTNGVPFNVATTTNFTVTGVNINGCQNTDQVLVTLSVLPVVNAGPDYSICVGQNITLTAISAGNALTWNNGVTNGLAFTVAAVGATNYIVTATNALGCQNTDLVIVNGNATPTVSVSANQAVCAGSAVNFTVATANGTAGFWSTNGLGTIAPNVSNTAITYTAATNDNASVQISYSSFNGCGSTSDTAVITVNALPTVNAGVDLVACAGSNVTLTGTGTGTLSWNNGVINSVVFPAVVGSTIYTLTVTNTNSCIASDQLMIAGNALPIINGGLDVVVCEGDVITLTATGATSYVWDNSVINGMPFAPSIAGSYTVLGTDGNGCESTDIVDVTINALPNAVAVALDAITINATPSGASAYQWINCVNNTPIVGETSSTFVATVDGSYAVIVTNSSGCSDTSNCVILNAVGISEVSGSMDAQLYPNPTTGIITVRLNKVETVNALIYDAQGKLISTLIELVDGYVIDISNMDRGMYMIQLTSGSGTMIQRIVKN
jgi:hypothetical protein